MNRKPRIGISSCLLGNLVRYDGRDKQAAHLAALSEEVEWVPVCPEVEFGFPVPREPIQLEGDPSDPKLRAVNSRREYTAGMRAFCRRRVAELETLDGFILKRNSPSCGLRVPVYASSPDPAGFAPGFFAAAWLERFPGLPAAEAEALQDEEQLREFLHEAGERHRAKQNQQ